MAPGRSVCQAQTSAAALSGLCGGSPLAPQRAPFTPRQRHKARSSMCSQAAWNAGAALVAPLRAALSGVCGGSPLAPQRAPLHAAAAPAPEVSGAGAAKSRGKGVSSLRPAMFFRCGRRPVKQRRRRRQPPAFPGAECRPQPAHRFRDTQQSARRAPAK